MRYLSRLQSPQEIWPNLRLDQNDRLWLDGGQRTPDMGPAVDRVIDFADLDREFFAQLSHASGGGR